MSHSRRAFMVFHAVLALALLIESLETLQHALAEFEGDHVHLAFVAGLEALGAILLLIPRTLRLGGGILLVILLLGFVTHLVRGDLDSHLLVFAAGVWYVTVHGAAWGTGPSSPA